jgi:hypothetical protein
MDSNIPLVLFFNIDVVVLQTTLKYKYCIEYTVTEKQYGYSTSPISLQTTFLNMYINCIRIVCCGDVIFNTVHHSLTVAYCLLTITTNYYYYTKPREATVPN